MSATLDESYDRHAWTLKGHRLTQLCVDPGSCRLQSWSTDSTLEIRLGVPFELRLADGSAREIDPEAPEQIAPLLTVIHREIVHLIVSRTGSLEVQLGDGSVISVDSHADYEAFEVDGTGELESLNYLANPGGGSPWGA